MTLNQAVILSLMVHALLILSLKVSSMGLFKEAEPPKLFVEFREEPQAPLMGESTQRVERQTRTRDINPSSISSMQAPQQQSNPTSRKNEKAGSLGEQLRSINPSEDDLFIPQSHQNISSGIRQRLQSYLPPELEIGDMVALNTDQNIYYSFYRRMAEKVVWPWAQNVISGFERLKRRGELAGANKSWITIIEVTLDKKGAVIAVEPLQLAGDADMDNAPMRAFKSAKNFPNPPTEMVDEDGYIHIRYRFVVHYNPYRQ
jgi:TonB family protein